MAYEILNNAQATPHRLYALARLVTHTGDIDRQSLLDLVAPKELDTSQDAAKTVLTAAQYCRLVIVEPDRPDFILPGPDLDAVRSIERFRSYMQNVVLGVTDETVDNFLFNQYSAWYAAQDDQVLGMGSNDYHVKFNEQMHADSDDRAFNPTKRNGWEPWAAFLGLGWPLPLTGRRDVLVPDAAVRIKALLSTLLPADRRSVPFGEFASKLAQLCPELDGGSLFDEAFAVSRSIARTNRLSLMLSNGLRRLHETGKVELARVADARDVWQLFPASGFELQQVSHIRLMEGE